MKNKKAKSSIKISHGSNLDTIQTDSDLTFNDYTRTYDGLAFSPSSGLTLYLIIIFTTSHHRPHRLHRHSIIISSSSSSSSLCHLYIISISSSFLSHLHLHLIFISIYYLHIISISISSSSSSVLSLSLSPSLALSPMSFQFSGRITRNYGSPNGWYKPANFARIEQVLYPPPTSTNPAS